MIHFVVGPDHLLAEQYAREIARAADPEGLNTTRFDAATSMSEVATAVSTPAFFGAGRVVLADGILARASGTGKGKKAEASEIATLLDSVIDGNTLILVDTALRTIPASIRALKRKAQEFTGKPPRGPELVAWVDDEVVRQGGTIDRRAVTELLNLLFPGEWQAEGRPGFDNPPDLLALSSEIAKLAVAADDKEITVDLVRDLTARDTQEQFFPLIDAFVAGNVRESLSMLGGLGEDEEVAARVLNQLVANAELAQIAVELRGSADVVAVAGEIGKSDKQIGAMQRKFSSGSAASLAEDVLESDRRLKSGKSRNPSGQLQDLLIVRAKQTRRR